MLYSAPCGPCRGITLMESPMTLPYLVPPDVVAKVTACVNELVTEDDTPVDGMLSEKQQRLLTEPLYSSWAGPGKGQPFLATANVGLFYDVNESPLVPAVLLSLGVREGNDMRVKQNRSYSVWRMGKVRECVGEIVSNLEGGEGDTKLAMYARLGIAYYIIYDPENLLRGGILRLYTLRKGSYAPLATNWLARVGLGLKLWR